MDTNNKLYLLIMSSRYYEDYSYIKKTIDFLISKIAGDKQVVIVSGGAKDSDKFAEHYAFCERLPVRVFHPKWKKYGKDAIYKRNEEIEDFLASQPYKFAAFFTDEFASPDMRVHIGLARKHNNPFIAINTRTSKIMDSNAVKPQ